MRKPQAEKLPNIKLRLPSGSAIEMDTQGRIIDPEDSPNGIAVNAKDLDAIYRRAEFFRNMGKAPAAPTVSSGHSGFELQFITEAGQEHEDSKPGDVYVGCEYVPFNLLARVHKLSLTRRPGKKSPAGQQQ